jgi:predicted ArsR family transcriptional regulator
MSEELVGQVSAVGALADPVRWVLYRYVSGSSGPVSREQASDATDLPRHTAKFHLDRLVDEGLLEVEYRRLSGRTGPGAGRPSKLYRRADRQVSITLPERRYDLAGDLLAAAIDRSRREGVPVGEAVHDVAHAAGLRIAAEAGEPEGPDDEVGTVVRRLAAHGYEPRVVEREVCLANCPFDRLAAAHTDLVCGMNLSLVEGVLQGLELEAARARLAPEPGLCCVRIAT